jgi:hypothetical protein
VPTKTVAVVIPGSTRAELSPDERVSYRHLTAFLGSYDRFLVVPRGLPLRLDGCTHLEFSPKYFGSMAAYNRLTYLPEFYRTFAEYKYILMYHLDALVFCDDLIRWCDTDMDFIGAPWLPCPDLPWVKEPGVGNGGFALMKVQTMLRVLENRYAADPLSYWKDLASRNLSRFMGPFEATSGERSTRHTPVARAWRRIQATETNRVLNDVFWGLHAKKYVPGFQVPEWTTALRFAFEAAPRRCFEMTGRTLPFGCHAWARYDREFWTPYLLPADEGRQPQSAHR